MPARIVREGIIKSRAVTSMSESAELFYRCLMSIVDDYGRCEADPEMLLLDCFPRRLNTWTIERLTNALHEAATCLTDDGKPLITLYTVGSKRFLQIENFGQRERTSKFPDPKNGVVDNPPSSDGQQSDNRQSSDGRLHASRARPHSESEAYSESEAIPPVSPPPGGMDGFLVSPPAESEPPPPKPRRRRTDKVQLPAWSETKFEEFWEAVWFKSEKQDAMREWSLCATSPDEADRIIAACKAQSPRLKAEGDRRIAKGEQGHLAPHRWLKRRRYDDEPPIVPATLTIVPPNDTGGANYTPACHREYVEPDWMKPGYDPNA